MIFAEPGTDATFDFISDFGSLLQNGFYADISRPPDFPGEGTVSSSTTDPYTGPRCISCSADLSNLKAYLVTHDFGVDLSSGGRCSYRIKIIDLPAAEVNIFQMDGGTGLLNYAIKLGTDGRLNIYIQDLADAITILVATSINPLATNTWQRIGFTFRVLSQSINECRVYVDGNLEISLSNVFLVSGMAATRRVVYGWIDNGAGANNVMYLDDLYVDNNDTLQDTGEIRVTAKRPASNNTNNFNTAIGNNPSNRWENVNERPISLTNGWREDSGGPYPIDENYGIEAASIGDFDLSGYSGTYPNTNPAIGLRTSHTGGVDLWECGVVIAFSDTTNSIVGSIAWLLGGVVSGGFTLDALIWHNGATFSTDRVFSNGVTTKVVYFPSNVVTSVQKPMIFHSSPDGQPFIFKDRP